MPKRVSANMADTRAYMALRYLLLILLLYSGLVWNSRLEYSDGVTKDGFCALSTLDIAGLSCVLGIDNSALQKIESEWVLRNCGKRILSKMREAI